VKKGKMTLGLTRLVLIKVLKGLTILLFILVTLWHLISTIELPFISLFQSLRFVLLQIKNKKLILGQARCLLLQVLITTMIAGALRQRSLHWTVWPTGAVLHVLVLEPRKRLMHGAVKGVMIMAKKVMAGVLVPQVPLGTNQASLWEIRNLLGVSQDSVMIIMEIVGADLDVEIEVEGEDRVLGIVDPHGMEATAMMNQVVEDPRTNGTGGNLMVAEEEGALGEVVVIKVTTLVQVMVAVGALAGETVGAVGTETGMITMSEGHSVKAVAGHNLLTGITTKWPTTEIRVSRKASLAGGVTIMITGEHQNHLVEMVRQETTPGFRTEHLSWVTQAAIKIPSHGVLLVTWPLEVLVLGERALKIVGILQEELEAQRNLHGVGQKLLQRKMVRHRMVKGAGAREAVVAVPGLNLMIYGTAIRVVTRAVADGK
jgi:hypothetical protein